MALDNQIEYSFQGLADIIARKASVARAKREL